MIPLDFALTLDSGTILFIVMAAVAVISAILVVEHKSLVYSALFLGILGMANAALFTLLGFNFIALFFVSVYIGAAVTFILFSVSMFEEAPAVERPVRIITLISVIVAAVVLAGVFALYFTGGIQPSYISYRVLASLLTEKYGFALIIAALTLVTTLIEAITIARKEEEK
ncbi:MAG TPA: NADH-quinone oxidoreductase subunit J [Candidatus Bathyarchaeia archaeon]|nr:NADH-quinone oxidoreductase subunit J [Candidatus Bathyarchaeia archaeon]